MNKRTITVAPMPLPEILQVPADARRGDYERFAGEHQVAVEGMVRMLCQHAQRVRPVSEERQDLLEATLWCVDRDLSDSAINTATRMRAVLSVARAADHTDGDTVLHRAYRRYTSRSPFKKDDPEWAPALRGWSKQGVYVRDLAVWKEVPLKKMAPHEMPWSAAGQAQFTHAYKLGTERHEDRYKADHTGTDATPITPIPAYEAVTRAAYDKLAVLVMEAVLNEPAEAKGPTLHQTLTKALLADKTDRTVPVDDLATYATHTYGHVAPSRRIADLAVVLRGNSPYRAGLPLTSYLLDTTTPEVAAQALLRKDMYQGALSAAGYEGYATNGFRWIERHGRVVYDRYYQCIGHYTKNFAQLLGVELDGVRDRTEAAQSAEHHLAHDAMLVPESWRKVAIT